MLKNHVKIETTKDFGEMALIYLAWLQKQLPDRIKEKRELKRINRAFEITMNSVIREGKGER